VPRYFSKQFLAHYLGVISNEHMSRFVNIKQSLLIVFSLILILFTINSMYVCLLGSSIGGNCGITFTFKVAPLFIASLMSCVVYFFLNFKADRLQAILTISVISLMWLLACFYIYAKANNYL